MMSFRYSGPAAAVIAQVQDIIAILNKKIFFQSFKKLIDKNILVLEEEMRSYKPKLVRYIRLHSKYRSNQGLGELLKR
jgi:primosomal protein N' (replication factor Y)